jgi:signal transduction histidine kinase
MSVLKPEAPMAPAGPAAQDPSRDGHELTEADLLRAEIAALQRQNQMLRETLDTIDGSIVVFDDQRRFLFANATYHAVFPHLPPNEELFGERYEDVITRSIAAGSVDDPTALTEQEAYLQRRIAAMEQRRAMPRDIYNARPGRESNHPTTQRWYLVRSRRTPSGNDVTLRVDITVQKFLQQELDAARRAAETASRMKSQFLANVTHELRTPLNAVINFARLIADQIHGKLGASQYRDYAAQIGASGADLLALIDELLDLARAEAGHLTIVEGIVQPDVVIAAVCRLMAPEAAARGVVLTCDVPAALSPLRGDATRLRQVLLNLVANALKFTVRGGTVRVAAAQDPANGLMISVRDTGIGIRPADLPRVMQPFEQARDPSTESRPGVGLGLPLARHLIELHGGTLTLHSEPEVGTTASFTLPPHRLISQVTDAASPDPE